MSKQEGKRRRARYTLEFKLEAVRLVKGGQDAAVTARVLDIPKATLGNWIRAAEKGELQGAGDRPVSAEQMELARLRAELARVKMERDILKNLLRGGAPSRWQKTPCCLHWHCQTVTVSFLEAHVPVKKRGPWGICGLSCGGASCDPV
jgi:transposase-like protein